MDAMNLNAKLTSRKHFPSICMRGNIISFEKPCVMGIINVNDNSFYAGSRAKRLDDILRLAEKHVKGGAFFLDIGGTSSRPGAGISDAQEEWTSLDGIFECLRTEFPDAYLSVDTYHAFVAKNAVEQGADLVNDISAGRIDAKLYETIAEIRVPYILMHMQGLPETMQKNPQYADVVQEVMQFLGAEITKLRSLGVTDIIVDPGFGFGKSLEQNYKLLKHIYELNLLDVPLLAGVSRKSMATRLLEIDAEQALNATTALHMLALMQGAHILRVHDTAEAMQAITIFEAYRSA
jgi:dihydropteroate synthase